MWNGFCGEVIRRTNRNVLILVAIAFAVLIAFFGYNRQYFVSFFTGAKPISAQELTSLGSVEKAKNVFVRVQGNRTVDTGFQHITKDDAHPDGYVDSYYLATEVDDQYLIVRWPHADADTPAFEGQLRPVTPLIQLHVIDPIQREHDGVRFLPYYLDGKDYEELGIVSLIFGIPVLALALWGLWQYLQRSGDFARHRFARRVAKYGQLDMLVQQIDGEVAGAHLSVKKGMNRADVTQHWLLTSGFLTGAPLRLEDMVWAYRHVMKRKIYFLITISKKYSVIAYDRFGQKVQVQLDEGKVTQVMEELIRIAPNAIYGYDKRLFRLWRSRKDKSNFLTEARSIQGLPEAQMAKTSTMMQG